VRVGSVSADGVPAEWIVADGGSPNHRVILFHGGGWLGGTLEAYRPLAVELARRTRGSVLSVDYRLVPEHPFPAGLADCARALSWAAAHAPPPSMTGNVAEGPVSISLIGDSAGSNLAAACCARSIAEGSRIPDRLVLIGPALDAAREMQPAGRNDFIVTPESVAGAFMLYSGGTVPLTDPRLSPMHTPPDLLAKFPPTLLQVSSAEGWIHDARDFRQRLEDANIRVVLSVWPDLPHVWHVFLSTLPEAKQAIQEIADFVRPRIDDGPPK
jgi:acetyl esterase/lipase